MPNRDAAGILKRHIGYSIGERGVEPRLKFDLSMNEGVSITDLSLENIVDRIILGPSNSSVLAIAGCKRLLDATNHSKLKNRVFASAIPFRSRH
jgi:hypothetical protein